MQLIDYEKLSTKTNGSNVLYWTIIITFGWTLFVTLLDHFINFSLLNFKFLLTPDVLVFIIGMWVSNELFELEKAKRNADYNARMQSILNKR